MFFFECSAKTGKNVEDIFYKSAEHIAEKIKNGNYDLGSDSCGIKQGGDNKNNIFEIKDDEEVEKKRCC